MCVCMCGVSWNKKETENEHYFVGHLLNCSPSHEEYQMSPKAAPSPPVTPKPWIIKAKVDKCPTNFFSFLSHENAWLTFKIIKEQAQWEKQERGSFHQKRISVCCSAARLFAEARGSQQCLYCPCGFFSSHTSVFLILSLYRKGRGAAHAVKHTRASKWCNRLP